MLDFARAYPDYRYTTASVIGRDPSPFKRYIQINKGSEDGLRRGMPVVTEQGMVGRISQIIASAALVQLITDPGTSTEPGTTINVKIEPEGTEAVLQGSITGDVSIEFIPKDADIEPGNLVLTSGLGGNLPPGITIGQITSVRSQIVELFQSATVQPIVDFSKLNIVLVITNFEPSDTSQITP